MLAIQAFKPFSDLAQLGSEHRAQTLLLTLYFFLALTAVSLLKAVQNGIYLANLGFDWGLPAIYLVLAILSGPIVLLYRFLARRFSHAIITSVTLLSLGVVLLILWMAISNGSYRGLTIQGFYLWCSIFTVLVPTQGWIISYHLFPPRTAKQVFVLLGAGGILGGVFGGFYGALAAESVGSRGLFFQVLLILVLLTVCLLAVVSIRTPRSSGRGLRESPRRGQPVRTILRSGLLTKLAGLVALTGLASTVIDLQYKWALHAAYPGQETEITQFVAGLLGATFLVSALIQVFGTSWVLRRFGLGAGLSILPAGLFLGSLGVLATAAFWAVVAAKGIDGSLRSSIEQTSVELLYVPLTDRQNIPLKNFMELVALRLGDGMGAAAFLVVARLTAVPVQLASLLVLLVVIVWLLLTRQMKEEYARLLRLGLENMETTSVQTALQVDEAVAENTLIQALNNENPRKLLFALRQFTLREPDLDLQDISSMDLGGEVLTVDVSRIYDPRRRKHAWLETVEPLTEHANPEVAAAAQHLLISQGIPGYRRRLRRNLNTSRIPGSSQLLYLRLYADDPSDLINPTNVIRWCEGLSEASAAELSPVLATARNPLYLPILRGWLQADSKRLRREALLALGRYAEPEDMGTLIDHLSYDWSRRAASRAVVGYADLAVTRLMDLLKEPKVDIRVKREIPNILAQIDTSSSRALLVSALYAHDAGVAYRALRGLNRIRERKEDLSYSEEAFLPLLQIWAREYYGLLNMDLIFHSRQDRASKLLRKAIKERLRWSIEKIFRGLDLFLPHGDAYLSYLGFTSSQQDLREYAIELIDSRIRGELRPTLLPIFAELHPFEVVRKGREIFKLPSHPEPGLSELYYNSDPWLKCCTIGVVAAERMEGLKKLILQGTEDINPMVRETAHWALAQWHIRASD